MNLDDTVWAKIEPYKSLVHHLIDTGACATLLVKKSFKSSCEKISQCLFLSTEETVSLVSYVAALHDLGKCHPSFQVMCKEKDVDLYNALKDPLHLSDVVREQFRHEQYSMIALKRIWNADDFASPEAIEELIVTVGLHHQGKNGTGKEMAKAFKPIYFPIQDNLEKRIKSLFLKNVKITDCTDWSATSILIEGIIICSDWIASSHGFDDIEATNDKEYLGKAMEIARITLGNIGIVETGLPKISDMNSLYPFISKNNARPMQAEMEKLQTVPQFAIVEDLMGSGKTEAAVYLAMKMANRFHKKGIYFALPTAATSNQMYTRLNMIFERFDIPEFHLIHGTAWAVQTEPEEDDSKDDNIGSDSIGSEWLRPTRKGLLSSYAVGTVDQAMMSVLQVKYSVLRMLGLSEKVLVIDEVHAYDSYMSNIIERLLEWCEDLCIPVILLSATLPNRKRASFLKMYKAEKRQLSENYPLLTTVDENHCIKEYPTESYRELTYELDLQDCLNDLNKTASIAVARISGGGNLCLMMNTVGDAQKVYEILKNLITPDTELNLYHARFTVENRKKIENKCISEYGSNKNRPVKSILVCTQVVEQSLDVDFDTLITQIAPIDLIIQRAGRIHRHDLKRLETMNVPKITILTAKRKNSNKSGTYYVYAPYILDRTYNWLKEESHYVLSVPNDIRKAVEYVYGQLATDMNNEAWQKLWFTDQEMKNNAMGNEIGAPNKKEYYEVENIEASMQWGDDNDSATGIPTRMGKPSVRVVLADDQLVSTYNEKWYSSEIQNEMLMKSVTLPLNIDDFPEPEKRGRLKGYVVLHSNTDSFVISNSCKIINNTEYGVIIRKE
jgi:CRISPR-associated endonuclease/helicase Cas3